MIVDLPDSAHIIIPLLDVRDLPRNTAPLVAIAPYHRLTPCRLPRHTFMLHVPLQTPRSVTYNRQTLDESVVIISAYKNLKPQKTNFPIDITWV